MATLAFDTEDSAGLRAVKTQPTLFFHLNFFQNCVEFAVGKHAPPALWLLTGVTPFLLII